jgi:type II secretory pathway component GspD/PulD (secretin)
MRQFNKTKVALGIIAASILSGCTGLSIPDAEQYNEKQIIQPVMDKFEKSEPAITKIRSQNFTIQKPDELPQLLRDKEIKLNLSKKSNVSDLAMALNLLGVSTVVAENEDGNLSETLISVRNYNGKLGNLLDVLSSVYDLSFNYEQGGIITIQDQSTYIINIIQNEDIIEDVTGTLERLGANEIENSLVGGNLIYKASPKVHEKIKRYIEFYSKNAAVIGLQVSVVTVQLDKKSNKGFDWSTLNVVAGDPNLFEEVTDSGVGNIIGDGSGSVASETADVIAEGLGLSASGTSMGLKFVNGDFNFEGVINYLSTYGKTEANQSTLMKIISGKEVSLVSTQSIPYVEEIELVINDDDNSEGITTASVDVGLDLTITPYFDSKTNMVTVDLNLDLSSLLAMTEINTGRTKITQPQTQNQTFTNLMKLKAGESSVIGGIMYDTVSDNRTGISYLEEMDIASQSKSMTKNAVFIILRPTVTLFGDFEKEKEVIQKLY